MSFLARIGLKAPAKLDGTPFIGLSLKEAQRLARHRHVSLRVVDFWTPTPVTNDFQSRRLTIHLADGFVKKVTLG